MMKKSAMLTVRTHLHLLFNKLLASKDVCRMVAPAQLFKYV